MISRRLSSRLRTSLGALLFLAAPLPALAQATPEEAARLQAIGEAYFGRPAPGEPRLLTIAPEGDHYRAALDVGGWLRRMIDLAAALEKKPAEARKAITIDWPPMSAALAPVGDGNWRFWDWRIPKFVADDGSQRTEGSFEGLAFDVVGNPATGITPPWTGRMASMRTTSTTTGRGEDLNIATTGQSKDVALSGETRAGSAEGSVDSSARQKVAETRYAMTVAGGAKSGVPDMTFTLTMADQDQAATIRGFRWTAILDLWAHLVAHHDPAELRAGQTALKAKIAAALPLFEAVAERGTTGPVSFESPFAVAKASRIGFDFDLAGLVRDGRFGLAGAVADLEVHSLFMPKWTRRLVPSRLALAGHVSGYDLATPVSVFLDEADFAADRPLTEAQQARIAGLFLPRGTVDVVLDGNRVSGPLYDVALDGRLAAGPTGATGAVTIRATGVERVAEHLASPEAADEQARTLAGLLAVARGFAERKGDDLVWRFDFAGSAVSVNGRPLK